MTPFRCVYGRDPPPLVQYEATSSLVGSVDQMLDHRDVTLVARPAADEEGSGSKTPRGAVRGRRPGLPQDSALPTTLLG